MRIHTDKLTAADLRKLAPNGTLAEVTAHGSRKRDHAFEVGLSAEHGSDKHGNKRSFARNSGQYGGAGNYDRAATWVEWGDWIAGMFKIDPRAIIGEYNGVTDFLRNTAEAKRWRKEKHGMGDREELSPWYVELELGIE
jgi:hypothetical protein